ncbi:unnamed protein product, partial [Phaeothamnion confervicola]
MAGVFSRARLWLILVLFAAATLPAAAQSARPKDKLHFGAIDYTFYLLPVETAQRQGFFAEESLDVDVTFIPAGKGPGEALLKNDINIAIASVEAMLQIVESGS